MVRKFDKYEIDLLYEQLRPDEEVLWKGKPKLIPNLAFLSSMLLILITTILYTIVVFNTIEIGQDNWYFVGLLLLIASITIYIIVYNRNYAKYIINVFYVVTNTRLIIFDTSNKKISFFKLYSAIKILNLKKSPFNTASIIFDVDILNEKIKEIGFKNLENADEIFGLIKHQIQHTKIKE